jgi:hypothetical protein
MPQAVTTQSLTRAFEFVKAAQAQGLEQARAVAYTAVELVRSLIPDTVVY